MSAYIEIHWTAGSIDEARRICRYLVQERYVACAQIIPWVESVYLWNNQLETSQESKVILKTKGESYEEVRDIILQNCSYEVPEISRIDIDDAHGEYAKWLVESIQSRS